MSSEVLMLRNNNGRVNSLLLRPTLSESEIVTTRLLLKSFYLEQFWILDILFKR